MDKRRFPRVQLEQPISIAYGRDQVLALADIVDLTVEGLAFNTEVELPGGMGLFVIFPGAEGVGENEVPAEVVRCIDREKENAFDSPFQYKVACRFIAINDSYLMDALYLVHGGSLKSRVNEGQEIQPSFFEFVGGSETLDRVHKNLYSKLMEHDWLKGFFKNVDGEKLVQQVTHFMGQNMGGDLKYNGTSPLKAHRHLFVSEEIFQIRYSLLKKCLEEEGLSEDICDRWLRIDKAFEKSVVKFDESQCFKRFAEDQIVIIPKP